MSPLYDLIDLVAWPTVELYTEAEIKMFEVTFERLHGTEEENAKWSKLMEQYKQDTDDFDAYDAIWLVFEEKGIEPYVDTATEYTIYIGVCVAWGILIGILAGSWHFIRKRI